MKTKHKRILFDCVRQSREHETEIYTSLCACLLTGNNSYYGFNKKKSHPLQKRFGTNQKAIYLHAEVDALTSAYNREGDISSSTLYVARTKSSGKIGMACPCEACREACKHFGVEEVIFTTDNGIGQITL